MNVATAAGTSPDPEEPEVPVDPGEDPEPTEDPDGHLTIQKVTTSEPENGKTYALDETITYEITVINDGNLTITDITVTDELTGDEWTIDSLAPGESETFKAEYIVTEEDVLAGTVLNVATAEGTSPDPEEPEVPVVPGEDPEPTDSPNGHLTVTKVTTSTPENGKDYGFGEEITYEVTVTNDGNVTVRDIVVTDELTGDEWHLTRLSPGKSATYTTSYIVTSEDLIQGYVRNEATAVGIGPDPENPEVPATPGITIDPTGEIYQLTITADDITIEFGEEIPEFTVTGEGFVDGEDLSSITFEITCDYENTPGQYTIIVTGDELQGHYMITFVPGTLTINNYSYAFTKGMGQHWQKGSGKTADFEVTRSVHDEWAFERYLDIEIDGTVVDKSLYKYEAGCVELYLSAEYMQTLAEGEHEIKAIFVDGEAKTNFFVDAEEIVEPPFTGDRSNLNLWVSMMLASFMGAAMVVFGRKKEEEQNA